MNRQDRENAIATALENGQHHAAALIVQADARLIAIESILRLGAAETARIQSVVDKVLPAQTEENRQVLISYREDRDTLIPEMRSVARSIRQNGGVYEASVLERLAADLESASSRPDIGHALVLRHRIRQIVDRQTNAEIRRWLLLALSPGSPVISNTGERIA